MWCGPRGKPWQQIESWDTETLCSSRLAVKWGRLGQDTHVTRTSCTSQRFDKGPFHFKHQEKQACLPQIGKFHCATVNCVMAQVIRMIWSWATRTFYLGPASTGFFNPRTFQISVTQIQRICPQSGTIVLICPSCVYVKHNSLYCKLRYHGTCPGFYFEVASENVWLQSDCKVTRFHVIYLCDILFGLGETRPPGLGEKMEAQPGYTFDTSFER